MGKCDSLEREFMNKLEEQSENSSQKQKILYRKL